MEVEFFVGGVGAVVGEDKRSAGIQTRARSFIQRGQGADLPGKTGVEGGPVDPADLSSAIRGQAARVAAVGVRDPDLVT